jgi:drug/metabolite transporter (DMT)-like permease
VFVGRWTVPLALRGTGYVLLDIRRKPHLIVWALLAGALWAVANTLTVFAIRNVGLSIAFPLWNTNGLIGLLWGWLLFGELAGADRRQIARVLGGAAAIAASACVLAWTASANSHGHSRSTSVGIAAALGAALLWGTMYVPYRKAYLSGMSPLSFVTIFAFGQTGAVLALTLGFDGGLGHLKAELSRVQPALFWLFLGGFCWVLGDLFQHYAAKYIGIGRGIPLSNTNQLWGLAWGTLVFGETAGAGWLFRFLILAGFAVMMAGAWAIGFSEAPDAERAQWKRAAERESGRYGLDFEKVAASLEGHDPLRDEKTRRRWWELAIAAAAVGIFVWLATFARRPEIPVDRRWVLVLAAATVALLGACGTLLWRRTRFS